jgi:hypothetical protein
MPEQKIIRYRVLCPSVQEAQQAIADMLLLEGCIDASICEICCVDAYFHMKSKIPRDKFPGKRSFIPVPRYFPGEVVTLLWYFPGSAAGSLVRITHMSYVSKFCYRYQVTDIHTKAVGWVDPEALEPLETVPSDSLFVT